jgi:hypothetical protein
VSVVTVNGRRYTVPTTLTLGEACDVEAEVGANHDPKGPRMMAALVWIAMRRHDPTVTFEEVRELDITEIRAEADEEPEASEESEDDAGPPVEGGERSESETTPALSGALSSPTSSASGPGRSET